jgi:hypothetical protein
MGNTVTKEQCVNIEDLPEFSEQLYTVKRTSGILETGWILNWVPTNGVEWLNKCAYFDTKENKWRIYTQNGKENPNELLYAWRDLEKIYPSSLKGDEIKAWREEVYYKLELLERQRCVARMKVLAEAKEAEKSNEA